MSVKHFCIIIDLTIDDELMELDPIARMEKDVVSRVEEILAADVQYIEMQEGTLEENFGIEDEE